MKKLISHGGKYMLSLLVLLVTLSVNTRAGFAESKQQDATTIKGIVTDEKGETLPGVSVYVKGTSTGIVTDIDGAYSLKVPGANSTLVFSYVGYLPQEIAVKNQTVINVQLQEDTKQLDEVVVTALGIKREKKALGYAVQDLKGEVLTEVRDPNMLNSLAGQVAGLQVSNNNTGGIGGSSRVQIRGEISLAKNGNSPLFVVDGIPISNKSSDYETNGTDFGSGAGDINPDDVESISVLKGPTAAALYGSRAANGAIVITTKSGKKNKGLGITYNFNLMMQPSLLRTPDYQYDYGSGMNGEYEYVDGAGSGLNDASGYCWGPRLNQKDPSTASGYVEIAQFSSPIDPVTGKRIPTPWISHPNFLEDFFQTGSTLTNNISISHSNDKGSFRFSYTNLDQKGMIPNTDLKRNSFALNAGYNLLENLSVNVAGNYVINKSDNMPGTNYWDQPIMYSFIWWGMNEDINSLKNYWKPGREGLEQSNLNIWVNNPYFTLYENTQSQLKNRIFGNVTVNYEIIKGLSLMGRIGTDWYNDNTQIRRAYSTVSYKKGRYTVNNSIFQETNADFLLTWNKTLDNGFQYKLSMGGNQMRFASRQTSNDAPELSIPGIYNLGNVSGVAANKEQNTEKAVNSLYGSAQFSYASKLFLDVTGRNDWSSTLPIDNNSYFYPSVSASAILSDIVSMPDWVSFMKARASWAQVGNDTYPYNLRSTYAYATKWGSTFAVKDEGNLKNENLKPEKVNSVDLGLDLRFFDNRLGLDLAFYKTIATNQILKVPLNEATGAVSKMINAGKIESKGVEVVLNVKPIKTKEFEWGVLLNWSTNRSYVRELYKGIDVYNMDNYAQARVGERMGDMYGWGFKHAPDGQFIYDNGYTVWEDAIKKYGNYNPDWMAGLKNTFAYKKFSLSFLLDYRKGGIVFSNTLAKGMEAGILAESVYNGQRELIVPKGVMPAKDSEGNVIPDKYVPNTIGLGVQEWAWNYHDRSSLETNHYDATYLKLREVGFGYKIPSIKLSENYSLKDVGISIVGRNLLMWSKAKHIDPESGGYGVEDTQIPTPRSIGVNLSVSF